MKKARATKILCAVLTVIMVLGTGLSAMAAVSTTSTVKYSTGESAAYSVITEVSGLTGNEMVTYMVHNASSMYNVKPANIDFIDQKASVNGSNVTFKYKGTGDWAASNKICVGAETLATPDVNEAPTLAPLEVTVKVNGAVVSGVAITGKDAEGVKKIDFDNPTSVIDVTYNGTSVDFYRLNNAIAFYTNAALSDEEDVIDITTVGASFVGDPTDDQVLSSADLIGMEKGTLFSGEFKMDGNGGSTGDNYLNGYVTNWLGMLGTIYGGKAGHDSSSALTKKYLNTKTLGELGLTTNYTVKFSGRENTPPALDSENAVAYTWFKDQAPIEGMLAAAQNGDATYDLDVSSFVPQGIILRNTGNAIALQATVPVSGYYKLITFQNSYDAGRTTNLTIGEKTLKATPDKTETYSKAVSAETVYLEAGTTYDATLNASAIVRFDLLALVPATAATDAAYAEGRDAILEYIAAGEAVKGDVGIKLGTVKVNGNSLVAFGRAKGAFKECGINIYTGDIDANYPALGVSADNGGFAIELVDEDGVDLATELSGGFVYGYVDNGSEVTYTDGYFEIQ